LAVHAGWLALLYVACFFVWLWLPHRVRTWQVNTALALAASAGLAWAGRNPLWVPLASNLLYGVAVFSGNRSGPRLWPAVVGAALLLARILMIPPAGATPWSNLVTLLAIYIGAYGFYLRRQSQLLEKQRAEELREAYAALQAAHQQLVETTAEMAESRGREERLKIAADIHDGVGHHLTSLIIGLEALEVILPEDVETAKRRLPLLVGTARQALVEVREAVHARRASDADYGRDDVDQLLKSAASDGQWESDVQWTANPDEWNTATRMTVFRVLQESLTNVLRHAQARHVAVAIRELDDAVQVEIVNDGADDRPTRPGFGLNQMRQRCEAIGGTLNWSLGPGRRFTVTAVLPRQTGVPS
jgi:signal transduction histidine kinase